MKHKFLYLRNAVFLLFIVTVFSMAAMAQKKPPLLQTTDNELSAFSIQNVKELQTNYNNTVLLATNEGQQLARQYRNRLVAIGIDQTDGYFFNYLKNDRTKRVWLQFLLDFLEIGAATAINITNGERAKDVIAEGLGALQASRTSLNKNFKLLERQILINQMITDRNEILAIILGKLDRGVEAYPWEAARADLRTYFNAGTLDGALSRLSATTGKTAEESERKVRKFKDKKIVSQLTPEQRKASKDAEENKGKLEDAVEKDPNSPAALTALKKIVETLSENSELLDQMKLEGIFPAPDDAKKIFDGLIQIAVEQRQNDRNDLVKIIDDAFKKSGKME